MTNTVTTLITESFNSFWSNFPHINFTKGWQIPFNLFVTLGTLKGCQPFLHVRDGTVTFLVIWMACNLIILTDTELNWNLQKKSKWSIFLCNHQHLIKNTCKWCQVNNYTFNEIDIPCSFHFQLDCQIQQRGNSNELNTLE